MHRFQYSLGYSNHHQLHLVKVSYKDGLVTRKIEAEVSQWLKMVDMDALEGFCEELKVNIPAAKQGNKFLVVR